MHYAFEAPPGGGTVRVRARLVYRRAFRALVDAKAWTQDGHGHPLEDLEAPHFGHLMEETDETLSIGGPRFVRGDCNGDGEVTGQVSDAVTLLAYSFLGSPAPPCLAACDADGDGQVAGVVTDAVYLLSFNFLGGAPPPPPFPGCGPPRSRGDVDLGCALVPQGCVGPALRP
ncbi:MAG: hypothetical protein HY721_32720 [Planctomycetes bacterium]|nr:hypothetical protein [Planctomycetota bacterium]